MLIIATEAPTRGTSACQRTPAWACQRRPPRPGKKLISLRCDSHKLIFASKRLAINVYFYLKWVNFYFKWARGIADGNLWYRYRNAATREKHRKIRKASLELYIKSPLLIFFKYKIFFIRYFFYKRGRMKRKHI